MTYAETRIDELERRLAEAEETLRAIREGEVDAVIVRGAREEQVFNLDGGIESFHAFMETMDPGAAAVDNTGRVLYANTALCLLLGVPRDDLIGHPLVACVGTDAAPAVAQLLERGADGSRQHTEIVLHQGAQQVTLHISLAPLVVGLFLGAAVTFTDVSDRVRAAQAADAARVARAIIASANEAVVVCDRDGIVTHVNGATRALYDGDMIGVRFADAVPMVLPSATGLVQTEDLVRLAVEGNAMQGIEAYVPKAPRSHDYLVSVAPLLVGEGDSNGCVFTLVDLTQRKLAEKQQRLLMAELDHRVKNTLALVLSISGRTASSEETLEGFQKAFTGRIHALAATHTLLAEKSWRDLSIVDVVHAELAPYGATPERVDLSGLEVRVKPRAAIALGLVFHELATNAVKYGALSVGAGRVAVSGSHPGGRGPFVVRWLESEGPRVEQPTRHGFGRTVVARSLQYSPEGSANIEFRPAGVFCEIHVPADDLIDERLRLDS